MILCVVSVKLYCEVRVLGRILVEEEIVKVRKESCRR